jgi:hypothetical protein
MAPRLALRSLSGDSGAIAGYARQGGLFPLRPGTKKPDKERVPVRFVCL